MPSRCNVCNSRIQKLSVLSLILFPTWNVVNDVNFGSAKVMQWVPRRHKVLTHGQERLFRKVTSVSIHSCVEWLDTFSYVLRPADVTVKEGNHIRCFAIDIAKDIILLSCRLTNEHLCVLQLETALATLVTTWFTLVDRWWGSRHRSSDQCIINAFRSPERYNIHSHIYIYSTVIVYRVWVGLHLIYIQL